MATRRSAVAAPGSSGVLAGGPHPHFGVFRLKGNTSVRIDPYGWEGLDPDPWAVHPQGAQSLWLWRDGQAPALFKQVKLDPNPGPNDNARVAITTLRYLGWRDEDHPNNEYVELTLDPRFAPSGTQDLTGYRLKNNRGATYSFPSGFILRADQPLRVYSGAGVPTATRLYWGSTEELWDDRGDCAQLINPGGGTYRLRFTDACN